MAYKEVVADATVAGFFILHLPSFGESIRMESSSTIRFTAQKMCYTLGGFMEFTTLIMDCGELQGEHQSENQYPSFLKDLLINLKKIHINVIELSQYEQAKKTIHSLVEWLQDQHAKPENCLLLTTSDKTLAMISSMPIAAIGYRHEANQTEELWDADMLIEENELKNSFEEIDLKFLERVFCRKHGIPWTISQTSRCTLREMTLEDLEDLYAIYQDKDITRYMENLYEREKEERYTKNYIEQIYHFYGFGMWIVVETVSGRIIGRAGLNVTRIRDESLLEMGYMICKEYQNKGYATEACKAVLAFAKSDTAFLQVNCFIQKENGISIHIADKFGFVWKEELLLDGKMMQRYIKILHE
ncbi:GNAT family N-acetyltransferase [Lachnospiraceae bacterium ZAX-1]